LGHSKVGTKGLKKEEKPKWFAFCSFLVCSFAVYLPSCLGQETADLYGLQVKLPATCSYQSNHLYVEAISLSALPT